MISREEVLRIAKLARLELTENEVALYQTRLGRVLDYIKELSSVDAVRDPSLLFVRHVPKDAVAFREDRSIPFSNARSLLENAPALEEKQFLLPTIVEHS
jgi:aspartyl-tRNA(Asn)/glutamyl-tRNA(Gln) amidotransferase subunit C